MITSLIYSNCKKNIIGTNENSLSIAVLFYKTRNEVWTLDRRNGFLMPLCNTTYDSALYFSNKISKKSCFY